MGKPDWTSMLSGHQYIKLETYRKSGQAVATPVWFTMDGDKVFVVTRSGTGKVKRLRNNQKVRVVPSGMRGEPKGEWADGEARFTTPEEFERALKQRSKKYGFKVKLAGLFSSSKGELVGIAIT
ncbi:MAG TPA: PPOX class F420-dependent oxidoreductase [Nitrososphaera sp.]|nr:PPOX class F420-dependent oxidoreductase [Nitrososphaera sp.]